VSLAQGMIGGAQALILMEQEKQNEVAQLKKTVDKKKIGYHYQFYKNNLYLQFNKSIFSYQSFKMMVFLKILQKENSPN